MRITNILAATAVSLAPIAAMPAQAATGGGGIVIPGDMCGALAVQSAQPLAGQWIATNRTGGGTVGPFGFALTKKPTENLTLKHSGGGVLTFLGSNDLGKQRLDMQPLAVAEDLPDTFNIQTSSGKIVEVNVKALLPCAWNTMPGYKGHIDYPLQGAGRMRMTVMLNFPSRQAGFGLLHFTGNMMGNPIDVWRYVTVTRSKGGTIGCNPFEPECAKAIACKEEQRKAEAGEAADLTKCEDT